MMCGRRPATWQESSSGTFSRSASTASDSMNPYLAKSETAVTPERVNFER